MKIIILIIFSILSAIGYAILVGKLSLKYTKGNDLETITKIVICLLNIIIFILCKIAFPGGPASTPLKTCLLVFLNIGLILASTVLVLYFPLIEPDIREEL